MMPSASFPFVASVNSVNKTDRIRMHMQSPVATSNFCVKGCMYKQKGTPKLVSAGAPPPCGRGVAQVADP